MKYFKLSVSLILFVFSLNAKTLNFSGKMVIDDDTGTIINSDAGSDLMIIFNKKYHYALVLPYHEKSSFKIEENNYVLFGNLGLLNISLEVFENNKEDQLTYLTNLNKMFIDNKDKYGVYNSKLLDFNKNKVLVTLVNVYNITKSEELKNIYQINYFSTKTFENVRYKLHFSVITRSKDINIDDEKYLGFMTKGFNIDYER